MVQADNFKIPMTNRDFVEIRVSTVGYKATSADDFKVINNISSTSGKLNTETTENDFFGDPGPSTLKVSNAPSVDITFTYAEGDEVHDYLLEAAWGLKEEGLTQIECDTVNGKVVSFICNVVGDNFGADGSPKDGAEYNITFSYAGGEITIEDKTEATE